MIGLADVASFQKELRESLTELGPVEGRDYVVELRSADGELGLTVGARQLWASDGSKKSTKTGSRRMFSLTGVSVRCREIIIPVKTLDESHPRRARR